MINTVKKAENIIPYMLLFVFQENEKKARGFDSTEGLINIRQ
jgi:hypothetical protein